MYADVLYQQSKQNTTDVLKRLFLKRSITSDQSVNDIICEHLCYLWINPPRGDFLYQYRIHLFT